MPSPPSSSATAITDLLDLARYRESAPHRETVRLDLLTEQAMQRLRRRPPLAAIETELSPCLVHVDPGAVDHAISNLVDNAIKWSPAGTPVRVIVADGRVSVSDHGPGIAAADLPHIFERFYRAPDARGMPGGRAGTRDRRQCGAGQRRYRRRPNRAGRVDIHARLSGSLLSG